VFLAARRRGQGWRRRSRASACGVLACYHGHHHRCLPDKDLPDFSNLIFSSHFALSAASACFIMLASITLMVLFLFP
jgi:hypothetical protein